MADVNSFIRTKQEETQFAQLLSAIRSGGGGGGGGSVVNWEQLVTSGEHIANIDIDGVNTAIFVPKKEDVYIENEQLIGTFLGKPLYRKCLNIPQLVNVPSNSWTTLLEVNMDYISKIIKAELVINDQNPKVANEFVIIYNKSLHCFRILCTRSQITGVTEGSTLILEYTKVGE